MFTYISSSFGSPSHLGHQSAEFLVLYSRFSLVIYFICALPLSRVRLFVAPWTVARQAPLSMEFSRQEYWSGLSFPSPVDLPDPGIEPRSPTLWADYLPCEPPRKPKNTGMGSLSLLQNISPCAQKLATTEGKKRFSCSIRKLYDNYHSF